MTDILKAHLEDAEAKYGSISIEYIGKTGGAWSNDDVLCAYSFERNQLANYIKRHPEREIYESDLFKNSKYVLYGLPDCYRVILGEVYKATNHAASTYRYEYAIIKIN